MNEKESSKNVSKKFYKSRLFLKSKMKKKRIFPSATQWSSERCFRRTRRAETWCLRWWGTWSSSVSASTWSPKKSSKKCWNNRPRKSLHYWTISWSTLATRRESTHLERQLRFPWRPSGLIVSNSLRSSARRRSSSISWNEMSTRKTSWFTQ